MHRKLGQADIHGINATCVLEILPSVEPPSISERLWKTWQGTPAFLSDGFKQRAGYCVRGIFLIGAVFDHNAFIHIRAVRRVGFVGLVRVYAVGIVPQIP